MARTKRIWREWQHPRASNGRFARKGSPEWVRAAAEKFRNAPSGLKAGTVAPGMPGGSRRGVARGAKAEALFASHDASVTTGLGRQPVQGPARRPASSTRARVSPAAKRATVERETTLAGLAPKQQGAPENSVTGLRETFADGATPTDRKVVRAVYDMNPHQWAQLGPREQRNAGQAVAKAAASGEPGADAAVTKVRKLGGYVPERRDLATGPTSARVTPGQPGTAAADAKIGRMTDQALVRGVAMHGSTQGEGKRAAVELRRRGLDLDGKPRVDTSRDTGQAGGVSTTTKGDRTPLNPNSRKAADIQAVIDAMPADLPLDDQTRRTYISKFRGNWSAIMEQPDGKVMGVKDAKTKQEVMEWLIDAQKTRNWFKAVDAAKARGETPPPSLVDVVKGRAQAVADQLKAAKSREEAAALLEGMPKRDLAEVARASGKDVHSITGEIRGTAESIRGELLKDVGARAPKGDTSRITGGDIVKVNESGQELRVVRAREWRGDAGYDLQTGSTTEQTTWFPATAVTKARPETLDDVRAQRAVPGPLQRPEAPASPELKPGTEAYRRAAGKVAIRASGPEMTPTLDRRPQPGDLVFSGGLNRAGTVVREIKRNRSNGFDVQWEGSPYTQHTPDYIQLHVVDVPEALRRQEGGGPAKPKGALERASDTIAEQRGLPKVAETASDDPYAKAAAAIAARKATGGTVETAGAPKVRDLTTLRREKGIEHPHSDAAKRTVERANEKLRRGDRDGAEAELTQGIQARADDLAQLTPETDEYDQMRQSIVSLRRLRDAMRADATPAAAKTGEGPQITTAREILAKTGSPAAAYGNNDRATNIILARQAGIPVRGKSNDELAAALRAKDEERRAQRAVKLNPGDVGTQSTQHETHTPAVGGGSQFEVDRDQFRAYLNRNGREAMLSQARQYGVNTQGKSDSAIARDTATAYAREQQDIRDRNANINATTAAGGRVTVSSNPNSARNLELTGISGRTEPNDGGMARQARLNEGVAALREEVARQKSMRDVYAQHANLTREQFDAMPADQREAVLADLRRVRDAGEQANRTIASNRSGFYGATIRGLVDAPHTAGAKTKLRELLETKPNPEDYTITGRARRAAAGDPYAIDGTMAQLQGIASANKWGYVGSWKRDKAVTYLRNHAIAHDILPERWDNASVAEKMRGADSRKALALLDIQDADGRLTLADLNTIAASLGLPKPKGKDKRARMHDLAGNASRMSKPTPVAEPTAARPFGSHPTPNSAMQPSSRNGEAVEIRAGGKTDEGVIVGQVGGVKSAGGAAGNSFYVVRHPDGSYQTYDTRVVHPKGEAAREAAPEVKAPTVWIDKATGREVTNPGQVGIVRGDIVKADSDAGRAAVAAREARRQASGVDTSRDSRQTGGVGTTPTTEATVTELKPPTASGEPTLGVTESSRGRTTTITLPDGTTAQRTSKTMAYTHAVVVMRDNRAEATSLRADAAERQRFLDALAAWKAAGADRSVLKAYPSGSRSYAERERGLSNVEYYLPGFEPTKELVKGGRFRGASHWWNSQGNTVINMYGNVNDGDWARRDIEAKLKQADKLDEGPAQGYDVWRWSQSLPNAMKGQQEFQALRNTRTQIIGVGGVAKEQAPLKKAAPTAEEKAAAKLAKADADKAERAASNAKFFADTRAQIEKDIREGNDPEGELKFKTEAALRSLAREYGVKLPRLPRTAYGTAAPLDRDNARKLIVEKIRADMGAPNARQQAVIDVGTSFSGNPYSKLSKLEALTDEDFRGLTPNQQDNLRFLIHKLTQRAPGEDTRRAEALQRRFGRWDSAASLGKA